MPEEAKGKHEIAKVDELKLPAKQWSKELKLVKEITAKNCTPTEFKLLLFLAQEYNLNPLKRELYAVKYGSAPAQIFISRDGMLAIAHRSGQFGSMETTCELEKQDPNSKIKYVSNTLKPISATCTIYRRDSDKPFKETVYFQEYNLKQALWLSKPVTMIKKVAEAQCLRKAFNVHGAFDSSEFPEPPKEKEVKPEEEKK